MLKMLTYCQYMALLVVLVGVFICWETLDAYEKSMEFLDEELTSNDIILWNRRSGQYSKGHGLSHTFIVNVLWLHIMRFIF